MPYRDPEAARKGARERKRRQRARERARELDAQGVVPLPGIILDTAPLPKLPRSMPADPAGAIAEWSREKLVVPPGHPLAGQALELAPFAVEFLRDALGEDREALLCIARKNAKSAICAVASLAFIAGPLARPGQRLATCSLSKDKAKEFLTQAADIAEASFLPVDRRRSPYPGSLHGAGGSLEVLSADRLAGHASGYDVLWADELGIFPERARELVQGLRSSVSARDGRFIALSIRGDSVLLQEMLDRDGQGCACHLYEAPEKCALDDRAAWVSANPGLEAGIKAWRYMEAEAKRVSLTPADESGFRAFDLNQRLNPARELFCQVDALEECFSDEPPEPEGDCILGLDLGGAQSLTSACAIWPANGLARCWLACGDNPALADRARNDNSRYLEMEQLGELKTFPGRVVDVASFVEDVAADLAEMNASVSCAYADLYKHSELQDALDQAAIPWPLEKIAFGAMSFRAVRAGQRLVAQRKVCMRPSLALSSAVHKSSLVYDARGNAGLERATSRGRIDALSAFVLAALGAEPLISNPAPEPIMQVIG